jgi:hypothetical protein
MKELTRHISECLRLALEFKKRVLRAHRETAPASQRDPGAEGKPYRGTLGQFVFASGAEWIADSGGKWGLLHADDAKVDAAVLELFEYHRIPVWILLGHPEQEPRSLRLLSTFVQLGLSLPMADFQHAYNAKRDDGTSARNRLSIEERKDAVNAQGQ